MEFIQQTLLKKSAQEKVDTNFDHLKMYKMLATIEARRMGF